MLVLTVQVHEAAEQLRYHPNGGHLAVYRAARAALGADASPNEYVTTVDHESTFDDGFVRSLTHHRRVSTLAKQQLQRFDQHRLSRAGLAGQHGQARSELEPDVLDQRQVAHMKLREHATLPGRSPRRPRRSRGRPA